MKTIHVLGDLEARLVAGERMTRADAERVLTCPDLVSVGVVGELARRRRTGSRVTFGRVMSVPGELPSSAGESGEVRIEGAPSSVDAARTRVREVVAWAGGLAVTGFSLGDLMALSAGEVSRLRTLAADLAADGLSALASVAVDGAGSDAELVEQLRAVADGGLGVWRLVVERAPETKSRLEAIERACLIQEAIGDVRAFAPLPRVDDPTAPSTGYDDVRTVAAARLRCQDIEMIQVDWPVYGPKLAQVAITFGANDIDGIASIGGDELGPRRAPVEDIRRQIRAAGAEPAERDARYRLRG